MYSLYLIILYAVLVVCRPTRKIALALTPWLIFGCSYDWMRLLPNYEVNPIDVRGLYEAEKSLFGIAAADGGVLTPCEFFARHHAPLADIMAGVFYLCWVPVPIAFALWLYFKGDRRHYLRFSIAFLFVNLLGFCCYYIHPAAPPWYVMNYGFEPILNTPGNTAGLARFDQLLGIPVFHSIYANNSNIFAAVPSLHAAYMLIALAYAAMSRQRKWLITAFAIIMVGIWWTAVYAGHHYVIDVLLGIITAIIGTYILEKWLMNIPAISRFMGKYEASI